MAALHDSLYATIFIGLWTKFYYKKNNNFILPIQLGSICSLFELYSFEVKKFSILFQTPNKYPMSNLSFTRVLQLNALSIELFVKPWIARH